MTYHALKAEKAYKKEGSYTRGQWRKKKNIFWLQGLDYARKPQPYKKYFF